eukprot:7116-Eustigmatos_ZCMA.PRE.1
MVCVLARATVAHVVSGVGEGVAGETEPMLGVFVVCCCGCCWVGGGVLSRDGGAEVHCCCCCCSSSVLMGDNDCCCSSDAWVDTMRVGGGDSGSSL